MLEDWEPEQKTPAFLDFDIEILPFSPTGDRYIVSVLHSPAGELKQIVQFPFSDVELNSQLKDIKIALLKSAGGHRLVFSPEETVVKDFGKALFNIVMAGDIRALYDSSQARAAAEQKGLRVKLRIKPAKLATVPWEFMYDYRRGEYLCLSSNTPVVRYIDVQQAVSPIVVTPPLKILGMISSPKDLAALDVMREKKRVEQSIRPLKDRSLVEITWLENPTWNSLQRAMRNGTWHIFHFIGHGAFDRNADEGMVCFEDENGSTDSMRATQLGRLLADHRFMRLVVLNSCEGASGGQRDIFSSTASILVRRGIPAVLAMQYDISDRAAIEFSTHFYEALADGMPVDAATGEARKAISFAIDNSLEWATPVLFMRSQDGMLFNFHRTVAPLQPLIKADDNVAKKDNEAVAAARAEAQRIAREKAAAMRLERERAAAQAAQTAAAATRAEVPSVTPQRQAHMVTPSMPTTPQQSQSRGFPTWFIIAGAILTLFVLGFVIYPMIRQGATTPPPTDVPISQELTSPALFPPINTEVPIDTAFPTDTALPTDTPIPTLPPSPVPIIPGIGPSDPGKFVIFYFDAIIYQKDFNLGWSLITDEYKTVNDLTRAGYEDTFNKTKSWEHSDPAAVYLPPNQAIVTLTATFRYASGSSWTPPDGLKYCMVRDESRNTWMIDTKRNCGIE